MKLTVENENYAATIVRINELHSLPGLDNLVGVAVFGHQALTQKDGIATGALRVAFTAETKLSTVYAGGNDLFRKKYGYNTDPEAEGYLEENARVKAIKLRGHRSDALLMPLSSLEVLGIDPTQLREGDTFDHINGIKVCEKYEIRRPAGNANRQQPATRAISRVSPKDFPEHTTTANFWRNRNVINNDDYVTVTQKLHGTSARIGHIPVLRYTGIAGRILNKINPRWNMKHAIVAGSRKVIKDGHTPGYYDTDIWTHWADIIGHKIPKDYMVFGEIIGWTRSSEGDPVPIQKNYTYDLLEGDSQLYLYRVTYQGEELLWEEVVEFAMNLGVRWVPELATIHGAHVDRYVDDLMDMRLFDVCKDTRFEDKPVALSDPKTVDEGVCVRQEALAGPPIILKAKSGKFLQHETKLLDAEVTDIESDQSVEAA